MTNATSLYTLARRVGGNIGYALAATLVARGVQIHRAGLVSHVTAFNPNLEAYARAGAALLARAGVPPVHASKTTLALANMAVNHQATMLAYNDVSWVFGLLFLSTIPLALLLPRRSALLARAVR
jgi:DHA2 family multidrug resistance protein